MVGDVVVGLKPNPLLPFGEESVVAGLSFAILHYYGQTGKKLTDVHHLKAQKEADNNRSAHFNEVRDMYSQCSWHLASVSRSSTW